MLQQFRKKLIGRKDLASRISLLEADAASFGLDQTFPAALMAGSFDHLGDDGERLASLANVARHLQDGAKLTLDSYPGLMSDSPLKLSDEILVEGRRHRRLIGRQIQPDRTVKITLICEIYKADRLEERIEQVSLAGIIELKRICALLNEVGFKVVGEYSDYQLTPYRHGDELLLIETQKST